MEKIKTFKILSIDGGGIKGTFPAAYLNYIQERIGNTPIHNYFDMIVGTSTGGIIATALGLEVSTQKILDLYTTKGKKIFYWSPRKLFPFNLIFPKYNNSHLVSEVQKTFGENTLLSASKCRLCIPAVDVSNGKALVFKTRHHRDYVNDHKMHAWKVAVATSAAPTFFPATFFKGDSGYIDGGLWANNPSIVGIAEAYKLGFDLPNIKILSLGTGKANLHRSKFTSTWFGMAEWWNKIIPWTFETQSQAYTNIARYLLPQKNYFRADKGLPCPKIFSKKFDLDNPKCVEELQSFATYRAKCDFLTVKAMFFEEQVEEFIPVPEEL